MKTALAIESSLQAEVEALRAQFPHTQDLYREVCVLLFFRHGIAPTSNKLYQLVRKGSMSAPAEALARFWDTLRERSRVRVDHPDVPESLRDAAGGLLGALWQRAQAEAHEALTTLREDAKVQVERAQASVEATEASLRVSESALARLRVELTDAQQTIGDLRADLARKQGEMVALQQQLEDAAAQRRELRAGAEAVQQRLVHEMEQQRLAAAAAEERHAAEARRLLLAIDRERGVAAQRQKDLEQLRRSEAQQAQSLRELLAQAQQESEAQRHRGDALQGELRQWQARADLLEQQWERQQTQARQAAAGAGVERAPRIRASTSATSRLGRFKRRP